MIDTCTQENFRDFERRYNKTYGYLIHNDTKLLVKISNIDIMAVHFVDVDGVKYKANVGSDVKFEFIPVDRGYKVGKDLEIIYTSRIAAHQWKRGICGANTALFVDNVLQDESQFFPALESVWVSSYTYKDSYNSWRDGSKNCALSKHFAIFGDDLYFYGNVIGKVKDNLLIADPMVAQELNDLIKRNDYALGVKTE